MSEAAIHGLSKVIKVLSTTVGRDHICKVIQYLAIYLKASRGKAGLDHEGFATLNENMWVTRKLLRFGLLWHYLRQIRDFTDPSSDKVEQGKAKKNRAGKSLLENTGSSDGEGGSEAKSSFSIFDFDTPTLKALTTVCNVLFCGFDIPLFLKQMNVLDLSSQTLKKISTLKHISWIMALLFTLTKQYILLRAVNLKIKNFKSMAFADSKMSKKQLEKFDGKFTFFPTLTICGLERKELDSINSEFSALLFAIIRTTLDLLLPLHYLGLRKLAPKTLGVVGAVSGAMSLL